MMAVENKIAKFNKEIESYLEGQNFILKSDEDEKPFYLKIQDFEGSDQGFVFKISSWDLGIMMRLETNIYVDIHNSTQMACMTEFICRVNFYSWAKLQIMMQDGRIQISSFVVCEDVVPSAEMIENRVEDVIYVFNTYAKDLRDIVDGATPSKKY